MTAETLSATAGMLLSLAAAYCPGFAPWFEGLDGVRKRGVLLALLTVLAAASALLACSLPGPAGNAAAAGEACGLPGALAAARIWIAALVANQAVYQIAVRRTPGTWRVINGHVQDETPSSRQPVEPVDAQPQSHEEAQ